MHLTASRHCSVAFVIPRGDYSEEEHGDVQAAIWDGKDEAEVKPFLPFLHPSKMVQGQALILTVSSTSWAAEMRELCSGQKRKLLRKLKVNFWRLPCFKTSNSSCKSRGREGQWGESLIQGLEVFFSLLKCLHFHGSLNPPDFLGMKWALWAQVDSEAD